MPLPVADRWFELRHLSDDVTLIWEPHVIPDIRCNIWHVRGRERDLLLDSGMGLASLREHVALVTEKPVICVASHGHFDHIGGHYEFSERAIHRSEAELLRLPDRQNTLIDAYVTPAIFSAAPFASFDADDYAIRPAPPTRLLEEGDVVDLGDRQFQVMHLPGHSPGSIALWEDASQILFSGDAVYDGPLYDDLYHSDIEAYRASLERLRSLPVRAVHGGHWPSFGRHRMRHLIDQYLAGKRRPGCPNSRRFLTIC